MNPFKGRHFERHIILWAVRWYCKYGISYRELQEMLAERGVNVDHTTIYRWVQRSAPEMEKRRRWYWRQPSGFGSWHLDETYVKVNGRWAYLYRAVDSRGCTIDFYLSSRRHTKAAYRFMGKLLNNTKRLQIPRLINTDKAPTYGQALALLKREGKCPQHVHHRQIQYRNNIIEYDHGKLKRIINATLGFKSMKTAYATIKGIEVMRALQKGQAESFYLGHPLGKMRLVSRVFKDKPSITRKANSSISLQQCPFNGVYCCRREVTLARWRRHKPQPDNAFHQLEPHIQAFIRKELSIHTSPS